MMITRIRSFLAAAALAAAGLTAAAQAQPAAPAAQARPVRNVVLVHGAFADGSGWRGVYDDLTARGYRVTIVGHSWGGVVITEAGVHPNVAGLVYVSALAPDAGETTAQQYAGYPPATEFVIDTGADGFGFVNPARFKAGFAADLSDANAAFLRDSQVPINMSVFGTRLTNAAWRSRPSWAVISTEDKAFGTGMLLGMARRIGATIVEIPGSHAAYVSQPRAVADVIDRAAQGAGQAVR
jgi:pimeloyl-ACP methyl ester carboxylesterase